MTSVYNSVLNSAAIRPFGRCHAYYLFFPSVSVRWLSRGKFVYCSVNILLIAYCTSRYINTIVSTCQVFLQRESFAFLSLLVKQLRSWICCVFHGNQRAQCSHSPDAPSGCFVCVFKKQGACSLFVFIRLW